MSVPATVALAYIHSSSSTPRFRRPSLSLFLSLFLLKKLPAYIWFRSISLVSAVEVCSLRLQLKTGNCWVNLHLIPVSGVSLPSSSPVVSLFLSADFFSLWLSSWRHWTKPHLYSPLVSHYYVARSFVGEKDYTSSSSSCSVQVIELKSQRDFDFSKERQSFPFKIQETHKNDEFFCLFFVRMI